MWQHFLVNINSKNHMDEWKVWILCGPAVKVTCCVQRSRLSAYRWSAHELLCCAVFLCLCSAAVTAAAWMHLVAQNRQSRNKLWLEQALVNPSDLEVMAAWPPIEDRSNDRYGFRMRTRTARMLIVTDIFQSGIKPRWGAAPYFLTLLGQLILLVVVSNGVFNTCFGLKATKCYLLILDDWLYSFMLIKFFSIIYFISNVLPSILQPPLWKQLLPTTTACATVCSRLIMSWTKWWMLFYGFLHTLCPFSVGV